MTDEPDALTVLADGLDYALLSSPDGLTYVLRCKSESLTARLSGDDASRLKADYQTIREQFPNWAADQTLAQLWDQGGYSWLAAEEHGNGDAC
ncbi:MAG: hypothetical protein ABSA13_03605 [Beijerinckiaceae bacterium]